MKSDVGLWETWTLLYSCVSQVDLIGLFGVILLLGLESSGELQPSQSCRPPPQHVLGPEG